LSLSGSGFSDNLGDVGNEVWVGEIPCEPIKLHSTPNQIVCKTGSYVATETVTEGKIGYWKKSYTEVGNGCCRGNFIGLKAHKTEALKPLYISERWSCQFK
jgi:hypothetical protein